MMRFSNLALGVVAVAAVSVAAPASAATVVHNGTPDAGWFFGSGNNYAPANSIVLTTVDGEQIALRLHERGVVAPASDDAGVYFFSLGQDPINFDWSIDNTSASTISALITVTNLTTQQSYSYNPLGLPNDNDTQGSAAQNSFRIGGFNASSPLIGWNPNQDNTFRVDLTVEGFAEGTQQISGFAQMGAGAAVPEPSTWAMLILGFGFAGAAMRRRRLAISYA